MKKMLLHELLEARATRRPAAIAIKTPSKKMTYGELAALSHTLAQQLIDNAAKSNQLVAIVMEKGWEQVLATLGVLKSGAAYLPIDPAESKERIDYLLHIGEVQIVLTQEKYRDTIDWPKEKLVIAVDTLTQPTENVFNHLSLPVVSEKDLAYVTFTSGSTGIPKGVMITHESVVNTILDINERFNVTEADKVLALSSLNFDLSVYDIFGLLAAGGTIVMPAANQVKDPTQWEEIFFQEEITIWNSVPALMDIFAEYLHHKTQHTYKPFLRLILLSGDWIPLNLPQKISFLFNDAQIISLGGATEASIWSILYPIKEIQPTWKSIPYGKAMKNQAFYVLDEKLELIKNDKPGELFIGGIGVAQGYWRDKERTDAQFISHPTFGRIYKTGDLGRYLPDGNIEFLGRVDFQVKIAGYRVEINAIEKYLLDFPSVNQAIVLVQKEGEHQSLVAYINFDYNHLMQRSIDYSMIKTEQVDYWKKTYDQITSVKNSAEFDDPTFNTSGWISSYFNEPIPKVQMQEWLENTIKRIEQLNPRAILEIGCGTGLLLFRLAKKVNQYDATDFSKSAIEYVRAQLAQLQIKNINLIESEAASIKEIKRSYDTILLNSIVQYFPSIDYFVDVLNQCIDKIEGKGQIFIGDIREFNLLNDFHTSILLHKRINQLNFAEWKNILLKSVEEENELTIDSNFFYAFQSKNKRISHVEILLKDGVFQNEMNCFRYDVILYIEHPKTDERLDWKNWSLKCDGCSNIETIRTTLREESPNVLAIRDIPNKRTVNFNELIQNDRLTGSENWHEIVKETLAAKKARAIDPGVFFEIANECGYHASMTWSKTNPSEKFDAILVKKEEGKLPKNYLSYLESRMIDNKNWHDYCNLPLLPRINRYLISKVKKFLQANLPYYAIPSSFITIKRLPITANGKIDRKALPMMTQALPEKEYVEPGSALQKTLAEIWQKILGIRQIGMQHNFYDIGGTSLLAVQLLIDIYKKFGMDFKLQELAAGGFTIKSISCLIEDKMKNNLHSKNKNLSTILAN